MTLNQKDHYLGPYGSRASKTLYDKIVGDWQANGRRLPGEEKAGITIKELILAYWKHAQVYYRKDGRPTSQLALIKRTLKTLRELYGNEPAASFGPQALNAVRQNFLDRGLVRGTCNDNVARIKRLFKWAAAEELIPAITYHALRSVEGLKRDRTDAPDRPPVGPVDPAHVEAVLKVIQPQIAAMIHLQDLTGMRPGEVCLMRPGDIDRTGDVWTFTPRTHKTKHHGRARVVLLGPQAQPILTPWLVLAVEPETHLFRPRPLPTNPVNRW